MKLMVDYNEDDLGSYNFETQEIRINLNRVKESCAEFDSDFYTLLLHVINHEVLHHIIYIEHGKYASHNLDNITHNKQNDDGIWEYWLA